MFLGVPFIKLSDWFAFTTKFTRDFRCSLTKSNLDLVRLLAAKTAECETLKQRLDKKRESINSSPATQAKHSHVTLAKDILLLGSSVIRDIEAAKNKDIVITSTSGGSILDITEECQATREKFKEVILVVGGNDCSSKVEVDVLLKRYEELVDTAMHLTGGEGTVKVSSVCPSAHVKTQKRIDSFNAGLAVLAGERECILINNHNSFKTLDGRINDCLLLPDGVHLNLTGTERLAKSLGVDKHARSVTSLVRIYREKKIKTSGDTQPDHGSRIPANSNRKVMRQTGSESSKRQPFGVKFTESGETQHESISRQP